MESESLNLDLGGLNGFMGTKESSIFEDSFVVVNVYFPNNLLNLPNPGSDNFSIFHRQRSVTQLRQFFIVCNN
jgi:hypothetical protein